MYVLYTEQILNNVPLHSIYSVMQSDGNSFFSGMSSRAALQDIPEWRQQYRPNIQKQKCSDYFRD